MNTYDGQVWFRTVWHVARVAASLSTCARKQVGAVLVPAGTAPWRLGWNIERDELRCNEGQCPRGKVSYEAKPPNTPPYDDCVATHAEVRVLKSLAGFHLKGYRLFVTWEPCPDCENFISQFEGLTVYVLGKGIVKEGK